MNETTARSYAARFDRVFDYIDRHLGEPLSVDQLSRVAHFSKFHFHRQFSLYAGIGVAAYVRMQRLKRGAYRLVFEGKARVIDIALDVGFESPEAFSRAFKQAYGRSPSRFRQSPEWQPWNEQFQLPPKIRSEPMDVRIVNFAETAVALLEHRGAPERLNDSVLKFIEWRKSSGLSPVRSMRTLGIAWDNPDTTEPAAFRFDICGELADGETVPANPQRVRRGTIADGRCAVVRHTGTLDRIGESIYPLYRDWLPASGEELRDAPLFFHYVNLPPEVEEHELLTDIYLPLK